MKKTELTATLSRTVNKVGLQIKKRSPEILIVAGVVGTVTSAVMACKATLKVDEIMRESNDTIEKVHKARSMDGQPSPSNPEKVIEYTADDAKRTWKRRSATTSRPRRSRRPSWTLRPARKRL